MTLYKGGTSRPDPWTRLEAGAVVPPGGHVILDLEQWAQQRERERHSNRPLGLVLAPGVPLDPLAADLPRFSLIALGFPTFSDGRAYSMARRLRHDFGFTGELRATGDVLFDQLQLMARCGFDAFEITHAATLRLLAAGRTSGLALFTQPGLGAEARDAVLSWRRRGAEPEAQPGRS
jgi:phosphoadenosine phosphosulfate reductase